jgi:hypothetical protein
MFSRLGPSARVNRRLRERYTQGPGQVAVLQTSLPGAGNLPKETLSYVYDTLGNAVTMRGLTTLVTGTTYNKIGQISQQCFTYDHLQRLTEPTTARLNRPRTTPRRSSVVRPRTGSPSAMTQSVTVRAPSTTTSPRPASTLYVAGEEIRLATGSTTPVCTRYYSYGGQTIASRTTSGLTWLISDQHGINRGPWGFVPVVDGQARPSVVGARNSVFRAVLGRRGVMERRQLDAGVGRVPACPAQRWHLPFRRRMGLVQGAYPQARHATDVKKASVRESRRAAASGS